MIRIRTWTLTLMDDITLIIQVHFCVVLGFLERHFYSCSLHLIFIRRNFIFGREFISELKLFKLHLHGTSITIKTIPSHQYSMTFSVKLYNNILVPYIFYNCFWWANFHFLERIYGEIISISFPPPTFENFKISQAWFDLTKSVVVNKWSFSAKEEYKTRRGNSMSILSPWSRVVFSTVTGPMI